MPSVDTILPNLTAPLVNTPKDIAVRSAIAMKSKPVKRLTKR